MSIIAFTLFTAMTIFIIPASIILAYMLLVNAKYHGEAEVYNIDTFSGLLFMGAMFAIYLFLAPNCTKYMPSLVGNGTFLICLVGSAAVTPVIIGVLKYKNVEKKRTADLEYQDAQIVKKIETAKNSIVEFEKTGIKGEQHEEMLKSQKQVLEEHIALHNNLHYQIYMHKMGIKESAYRNLNMKTSVETTESVLFAKDRTGVV